MNDLSYIDYLFLNCFSTIKKRKEATLFYILTGKRTISTMLQCSQLDLEPYFGAMPDVKYPLLQGGLERLTTAGYLELSNDAEYVMTPFGEKERAAFFEQHPGLQNKNQMRFALVLEPIKTRVLFLVQVLSEMRHHNKKYYPIETNEKEQLWVKKMMSEQNGNRSEYAEQFGMEILSLLESFTEEKATVFAYQFEGHQHVRKTVEQIAQITHSDEMEVKILLQDGWLDMVAQSLHEEDRLPLLSAIAKEIIQEKGLASHSAEQTMRYFKQGYSLPEIVSIRKLKQSTIQDHFSELAMLYPSFPFRSFVSEEEYAYLGRVIRGHERVDYREIQAAFPGITFFESRLIQIASEVYYKHEQRAVKN